MRRSSMAVLIAPLVLVTLAQDASAQVKSAEKSSQTVRPAIEAANARFASAIKSGDAALAATIYTDDAIVFAPGEPVTRGREAIAGAFGGWLQQSNVIEFTLNTEEVVVNGDYAFESGTYSMTMQAKTGGSTQTDKGKYLTVWQRQKDGSWKLHRDAWNSDQAM